MLFVNEDEWFLVLARGQRFGVDAKMNSHCYRHQQHYVMLARAMINGEENVVIEPGIQNGHNTLAKVYPVGEAIFFLARPYDTLRT